MGKVANAGLEILGDSPLPGILPGIGIALDRQAMHERLQDAMAGPPNELFVQRCGLSSAILLDDRCAVVRYELEMVDRSGKAQSALVTGRVHPDAEAAEAYARARLLPLAAQVRGRSDVAPFASPVAVIADAGMAVYAFPIDGELPTLAAATHPGIAARAMKELLAKRGEQVTDVDDCTVEPVHYNRRHRCMLRYRLGMADGRQLVVYGKVANDGSGPRSASVTDALRPKLAAAEVAVPRCLGFVESLQLVAFTEIAGSPAVAQLLKSRLRGESTDGPPTLESAVERCGQIAAALHTSGLGLGKARPLETEVAVLRANLAPIERLSPVLAHELGVRLDLVERRATTSPALELVQCHGDFSYTQLVFDGLQAGLVDFDNFCQAEAALDLGQFHAYLHYAGLKARPSSAVERAGLTQLLVDRFDASYVAAGGPPAALERVALYEVTNLIRMAQHAWHNLKRPRLDNVMTALDERLRRDN